VLPTSSTGNAPFSGSICAVDGFGGFAITTGGKDTLWRFGLEDPDYFAKVTEAAPFSLGGLYADVAVKRVFLADAGAAKVRVFNAALPDAISELAPIVSHSTTKLPPRALGGF
jgi:hypothetical protein